MKRAIQLSRCRSRCRSQRAFGALGVALVAAASACSKGPPQTDGDAGPPPWAQGNAAPAPRPGMVWVPPGELVAGTPPGREPRVADAEMSGERVAMTGFWIDEYLYPNEAGALPTTGISRDEAIALCGAQSKRLCTELELERACKGPGNFIHPWGDVYRASACGNGTRRPGAVPNGFFGGCTSPFGVHDLVGNAWSWTSSDWGRGDDPGFVAVRGGADTPGELLGRCAHADKAAPTTKRADLGVRCCDGPTNAARVELSVQRGDALDLHHEDEAAASALEALVPEGAPAEGVLTAVAIAGDAPKAPRFEVEHVWTWRPLGNEELRLGGGCETASRPKKCGLVIARPKDGGLEPLAFASTDRWTPTLSAADGARVLWVFGGDRAGAFRKRVAYDWGRVAIGADKERKKKRKGKKPGWDGG